MKKLTASLLFFILGVMSYSLNFTVYPTRFEVDSKKVTTE